MATSVSAANGFAVDAKGKLTWAHNGLQQTVYPVFRNLSQLRSTLVSLDAQADYGDGSYRVTLLGQNYQLRPGYPLTNLFNFQAVHVNETWWQENGMLCINYGNRTAQGFVVQ